jgi:hypothetical protein
MHNFWKRAKLAWRCFFAILLRGEIPAETAREVVKRPSPAAGNSRKSESPIILQAPAPGEPSSEPFARAVQILALLQRDGRLIDFLSEDIAPYPDEQLGAAVRDIQGNCRKVLSRYLQLEPIADGTEDQPFTVPAGFDPAWFKLIGNVKGEAPIRGILRHRGWRVKEFNLPSLPRGLGRTVVAAAEVELA